MSANASFVELRGLLEALVEERITDSQIARLEELLRSDERFERYYITYMTMQADLIREFGAGGALTAEPALGRDAGSPRAGWLREWKVPWAMAAAACIATVAAIGLWRRTADPTAPPKILQTAGPAMTAGRRETPANDRAAIAVVVKQVDARWESTDDASPAEDRLLGPGRLRLRSGSATLAMVNGVMLTIEGPAEVDLVSVDRVFALGGKLRARVPKGAEGFVIASPSSAVVDLGTEFAMNVDADGRSRVMVFEGQAEAALLAESGDPKRLQLVEKDEAFVLDPARDRIDAAPARADGFASAHSLAETDLKLSADYPSEILRSGPAGYWRFSGHEDGQVANEIPGGRPLRIHGPVAITKDSEGEGCAVFKGDSPEQYLDAEGLWTLPGAPGHAVEFWAQPTSFSQAALVGMFAPDSSYMHSLLVEYRSWERIALNKPASVKFVHRWPLDMKSTDAVFSESVYIPRRWHHVVAQKNHDRLDLFFDGVRERSITIEPGHPTVACRLVVGRRTPNADDPRDARSFVGRIDELAVYDHPLTDEEVRRHFRLGAEQPRPD